MTNKFRTEAIVLKVLDLRETDLMVTFFSKNYGKLTGIAKSARKSKKRFGTTLDLFNVLDLSFSRRQVSSLVFLEEAHLLYPSLHLMQDLRKISAASYCIEVISELSQEGDPNPGQYALLKKSLRHLEEEPFDEIFIRCFELSVLTHAGLKPEVTACIRCRADLKDTQAYFVFHEGGAFCSQCLPAHQPYVIVSPKAVQVLQAMEGGLAPQASPAVHQELRQILPVYLRGCLGKELQSRLFMNKLFASRPR